MEIFGLPAHVLVVHAAVVLTPLAVLAAVAFALLPKWRYLTRWPAAALAVVAGVTVWVSRVTGQDFFGGDRFGGLAADNPLRKAIHDHEEYGELLSLVVIAFVLLVLVGSAVLGGPSGFVSGRGAKARTAAGVEVAVALAILAAAAVTLVYLVLTGDAGARAAWGS
jgi:hypothetical protein